MRSSAAPSGDGRQRQLRAQAAEAALRPHQTLAGIAWRSIRRKPGAIGGIVILVLLALTALAGPLAAPHDPLEARLEVSFGSPSRAHPLGTDELGRDTLSRLLFGARVTLLIPLVSVSAALAIGSAMGIVAGYKGGVADDLLMRFIDMLLAIPSFLLAVAVVATIGPGLVGVILAVGVASIPPFARIARGATLSVVQEEYVAAARSAGGRDIRIMARHVLPNVSAPLIVQASLRMATGILLSSGLSFLGLGPQPPAPEWGLMLSNAKDYLTSYPWLAFYPGAAIFLVTISVNLVGDGLRDALDPRLR